MRPGLLVATAVMASGIARAEPGLPPVVDIAIPDGGGSLQLAVPAGFCAYPSEVRQRLARFLSDGGLRLLGAAGDCDGIERLMREGKSVVASSFQLAMLESDVATATRSKPATFRRQCFEQFPDRQTDFVDDPLRHAVKDADAKLSVGQSSSMGRLAATRDAVFGGSLLEVSREPDRLIQIQVTACFSPAGVPVLWTFQATSDRGAEADAVAVKLRSVLALAEAEVASTVDINRGSVPAK